MVMVVIAMALLLAYTLAVCLRERRIPESLSKTVFWIQKDYVWLWTLMMALIGFAVVPFMMDHAHDWLRWLVWLAVGGLLLVAVAPLDGDSEGMAYKVHMTGAWMCAVASQLLIAFCSPKLLLMWVPWVIVFLIRTSGMDKWKTISFWAELVCFADIFAFCLTK